MKGLWSAALILSAGCLPTTVSAQALPHQVYVPSSTAWCATSQPLDPKLADDPTFGPLVFELLYSRIEQAALMTELPSTGIPFADSGKEVIAPAAAAAGPPDAAASTPEPVEEVDVGTLAPLATAPDVNQAPIDTVPESDDDVNPLTYVVRVCALVPSGASANPDPGTPGIAVKSVVLPASNVLAIRCDATQEATCKNTLLAAAQSADPTFDMAAEHDWIIRQALQVDDSAEALERDLTDTSLRSLKDGNQPVHPSNLIVVALLVP